MSAGSTIELPYNGETITVAEAATKHVNDFMAKYPDVDLNEVPEATHSTDYRNMCGRHNETGKHDPVIVFCAAVTTGLGQVKIVSGLILLPSEDEGKINTFRRIGSFDRGENGDFESEMKREICII
jgi:hypothetical protein